MCFVRLHALPCSLLFFFFRDVCQLFLSPRSQKKKMIITLLNLSHFFFFCEPYFVPVSIYVCLYFLYHFFFCVGFFFFYSCYASLHNNGLSFVCMK